MVRLSHITRWLTLRVIALLLPAFLLLPVATAFAQGVTTGSITGVVLDTQKRPVPGAEVVAIHTPSGTTYQAITREDGRFVIPGMRVGGPYSVVVAPTTTSGTAFQALTKEGVTVNLGASTDLSFEVQPVVAEQVTVVGKSDPVFSSSRTGAATTISRDQLASLPTIGGRLNDMTRLTPQYGGSLSFGGQDNRLNNITVDGSSFNNSFGLRNTPGDTSGVAPISLAAIEEVQVNLAPYDVRQGNFVGAAVNTVTRSGGNQFRGSFYHQWRDDGLVGTKAKASAVNPGTFTFRNTGGWASGPITKNKAFFFFNYENEATVAPGTTFRANNGGEPVGGSVTRVLKSDLDALSAYLKQNFGYDTGAYQGFDFETPAKRLILKGDYNLNDTNKITVRYNQLDSYSDRPTSNSSSVGFGNRNGDTFGLSFQNSSYAIQENIRSIIGEWNSVIGTKMANSFIIGWTKQDENRKNATTGPFFPFVDILEADRVYTSFGFEPFTPNNELVYTTFQLQNNLSYFTGKHSFTFGYTAEKYHSDNVFNSARQGVYVYNSLADFYTDANAYLANPNRTTGVVTLRKFDHRYNNIPGQEKPLQPLDVFYTGAYVQDDWRLKDNFTLSAGLRFDVPIFGDNGFANPVADAMTFRDQNGNPVQYSTGELPPANVLWSPRAGFNWDVNSNKTTQVRGGSGVFTGRPAYVWISNQVGNTGMLTGTDFGRQNVTNRFFHPDGNYWAPVVTGAPAASTNLELITPDFKFPQVWRTNIAVDQKLPGGWTGTVEYIYNRDVNGLYYSNDNLPAAQTTFAGADQRMRWTSNRINNVPGQQISTAVVLKNQNIGRSWNIAGTLEKRFQAGLWIKTAYSYGEAKNTVDPGSIATGSWTNNAQPNDPNNPPLAFSSNSPGHRFFAVGSYSKDFFKFGATTVSLYWESRTISNTSYIFASDANGDGGGTNDLLYIPRDQSEMNFVQFTASGVTYTAAQQAQAWDDYIKQDEYLSARRGQYAERGAVFLPLVQRADFSLSQDFGFNIGSRRHTFQFRWDVDNFTNLLNSDWGVSQRIISNSPLTNPAADAQGRLSYRLRVINGQLLSKTYEPTATLSDVYRMMFTLKYTF